MVNWRSAAYIGLFLISAVVFVPGCGETSEPPPEAADQEEGFEIEIDLGSEIEPPTIESSESSEPDSTDESANDDVTEAATSDEP